ncbi:ferrichrome ABC transporter permease, partial [bacterium]|nr:ferrichrome ABC transporter permease [bacterium]
MLAFAAAIFSSAFLLFQVQPILGKYILPWFGGSPNVWTACLLFFQMLLLGGYAYAHFIGSWATLRKQVLIHAALLGAAALALPVVPGDHWKPLGTEDPVGRIVLLLATSAGLPY